MKGISQSLAFSKCELLFNSINITIVHSSFLVVLNVFVTVRLLSKTFSVFAG